MKDRLNLDAFLRWKHPICDEISLEQCIRVWVKPWSPYHILEKFFFPTPFDVKIPVWSEKHLWS